MSGQVRHILAADPEHVLHELSHALHVPASANVPSSQVDLQYPTVVDVGRLK